MEPRFGHDFSRVRVHTNAAAAKSARAVHAAAYTVGHQVAFATSRYSPQTVEGQRLLAHELAHVVQQGAALRHGDADTPLAVAPAGPRLQRVWHTPEAGTCDDLPKGVSLDRVIVEQETPQSVTLVWSDGNIFTAPCSAGKGHCCVAPTDTEGVGCTETESRRDGSNCTAINTGAGHAITERKREHNGYKFWNTFVAARGIALHQHYTVTGRPLSHGCVRVQEDTARRVFCGARQNATRVEVRGYARPRCDDPNLLTEWEGDFRTAAQPTDGEKPKMVASIREHRKMLRDAYGRTLTPEELRGGAAAQGIPRCDESAAMPSAEERELSPNLETKETNEPKAAPSEIEDPFAEDRSLGATRPAGREVLAKRGFTSHLPQLSAGLAAARSIASARNTVRARGRALWKAAQQRAEGDSPDTDDRALHFSRLEGTRLIRQWSPAFPLKAEGRAELIQIYEDASRGIDTVTSQTGGGAR